MVGDTTPIIDEFERERVPNYYTPYGDNTPIPHRSGGATSEYVAMTPRSAYEGHFSPGIHNLASPAYSSPVHTYGSPNYRLGSPVYSAINQGRF
jgi:hypothetical protein